MSKNIRNQESIQKTTKKTNIHEASVPSGLSAGRHKQDVERVHVQLQAPEEKPTQVQNRLWKSASMA